MRVYLSGGMEYANNEGRDWRQELQQWLGGELGWEVFNPNVESDAFFRTHHPDTNFRSLKSADLVQYRRIARRLVEIDSTEIETKTDILVCYWDEAAARGAGTKGEVTLAKHFGKPVYLVTSFPAEEIPGWVLGCTTLIFSSFDELKMLLLQEHKK